MACDDRMLDRIMFHADAMAGRKQVDRALKVMGSGAHKEAAPQMSGPPDEPGAFAQNKDGSWERI